MADAVNLKSSLLSLAELKSVEGALVVDSEGLILENTFSNDVDPEHLGSVYAIIDLTLKAQLAPLQVVVNQTFFSCDDKLIVVQKIEDVLLVLYTKKENLIELQQRLEKVSSQVYEFLNISRTNS